MKPRRDELQAAAHIAECGDGPSAMDIDVHKIGRRLVYEVDTARSECTQEGCAAVANGLLPPEWLADPVLCPQHREQVVEKFLKNMDGAAARALIGSNHEG